MISSTALGQQHSDRGRERDRRVVLPLGRWRHQTAKNTYPYGYMMSRMARAATTADVFNAIAEPRRRQLLNLVAGRERSVNDLVAELGLIQPLVSKHLRVLRAVGVVRVRDDGRRRLYQLNREALRPISDWLVNVEALWADRLDRLESVVTELTVEEGRNGE